MRLVVANEPRAYREVIAAVLRALRPEVEVFVIEPVYLDQALKWHRPHLVLCSCPDEVRGASALAWVALYPGGETETEVCIDGERFTVVSMEFEQLLSIIDETTVLAHLS